MSERTCEHMVEMTSDEVRAMLLWCRENRIPIVEKYTNSMGRILYMGSGRWIKSSEDFSYELEVIFLIRTCDLALWKLKFG